MQIYKKVYLKKYFMNLINLFNGSKDNLKGEPYRSGYF